jgi:hypothetical protein
MFEEESVDTPAISASRLEQQKNAGHITGLDPFSSRHRNASRVRDDSRIAELEIENLRLQRLVAELLLKNQQLRKFEN